jgi:FKBP-type peptidyl-prolyl cis-trans isomerase SlyD
VTPEEGYGDYNPELQLSVHRSQFPQGAEILEGMQFVTHTADDQEVLFTVESVQGDQIQINGNHPLAGETLHFAVDVLDVRDATAEELAHGHAHDGHEHHHH